MANPSTAHEPSMEEILASIRQIISEDGEGSAAPAAGSAGAEAVPQVEAAQAETFEAVVSRFDAEPEPAADVEPPVSRELMPQPVPGAARPAGDQGAAPTQRPVALTRRPEGPDDDGPLLSPEKGAAVSGAFGTLAQTMLAQSSRTLEDVVTAMLQPMLKSWLDDNLPSLVERMVKEEIERVSRGRR